MQPIAPQAIEALFHAVPRKLTGRLVGEALIMADFYLIPRLKTAALPPQGAREIAVWPAVNAWMQRLEGRPAYGLANYLVLG